MKEIGLLAVAHDEHEGLPTVGASERARRLPSIAQEPGARVGSRGYRAQALGARRRSPRWAQSHQDPDAQALSAELGLADAELLGGQRRAGSSRQR